MDFIEVRDLKKIYTMGEVRIDALSGVNFSIKEGEFVLIIGPSGAGKSTILNLLGGMDKPTAGSIFIAEKEISKYNSKELTTYRRYDVGFVFQFYNLVPNLNALENVELAKQIGKSPLDPKKTLESVGLADRLKNFPSQLSGGEQQRVSIARAMTKNPKLLLCDEPTGALDYNTGKMILKLLYEFCRQEHKTVIIISHNTAFAPIADKVIKMKNGGISEVVINDNPISVEEIEW